MIFKKTISKKMVTNIDAAKMRHRRGCDHVRVDWEKVVQNATKFKAIPCHKPADRIFLLKVVALSQTTIPPWAVWDALEAVKQIGPRIPIAYFRTVVRDNCSKAGGDLDKTLRTVKVPANLPRRRASKHQTIPIYSAAERFSASELQEVIR